MDGGGSVVKLAIYILGCGWWGESGGDIICSISDGGGSAGHTGELSHSVAFTEMWGSAAVLWVILFSGGWVALYYIYIYGWWGECGLIIMLLTFL